MNVGRKFENLLKIMERLRRPDGCPWDREQTHESLRSYLLEEAYEVIDCIDRGMLENLPEELGDVLLQVIFHAQIGSEQGTFTIENVIEKLQHKLISRHPHVFGDETDRETDVQVKTAEEQARNWERLKKNEGQKSSLDGVPASLPALQKAYRIQQKAAAVGFDWPEIDGVWQKVEEELEELRQAYEASGNQAACIEEMGDLLFAMVNLARFLNCNPEDALREAVEKFSVRFRKVEEHFQAQNCALTDVSLEEMDRIWDAVKLQEKNGRDQEPG